MAKTPTGRDAPRVKRDATTFLGAFCLMLGCVGVALFMLYSALPTLLGLGQAAAAEEEAHSLAGGIGQFLGVLAKVGLAVVGMLMLARRRAALLAVIVTLLISAAHSTMQIIMSVRATVEVKAEILGAVLAGLFYLILLVYLSSAATRREFDGGRAGVKVQDPTGNRED